MLFSLTTRHPAHHNAFVRATQLLQERIVYSERAFAEVVVWKLAAPLLGSHHLFKYRLALVVDGRCVLRFDNEAGKGDHLHLAGRERHYKFSTIEQLLADFQAEIRRIRDEDSHS